VLVRGNHLDFAFADLDRVAAVAICGLSLHDDRPVPELHEVLCRVATGIRLFDAPSERALAADRHATGGRRGGAGEDARCQHEHVVGAEGFTGRIALVEQDPRGQRASAQHPPVLGIGFGRGCLVGHVHPNQAITGRSAHHCPPSILEPSILEPSVLEPSILEPSVLEPSVLEPSGECLNITGILPSIQPSTK
jgi:hypothetical protein